jgi:hypothetical protein
MTKLNFSLTFTQKRLNSLNNNRFMKNLVNIWSFIKISLQHRILQLNKLLRISLLIKWFILSINNFHSQTINIFSLKRRLLHTQFIHNNS